MKNVITATAFATMLLSGAAAADNGFPCTTAQFWISGIDTVPTGAEMHKRSAEIAIAAHVLKPRLKPLLKPRASTQLAQQSVLAGSEI